MKTKAIFALAIAAALGALIGAGCNNSNPVPPQLASFQPEIINSQDSFQFQATSLKGVTTTVSYNWENTATQASIDHSSAIQAGTTLLEVLDANQTVVYSDSLKASANEPTNAGTAGTWTVRVTLTAVQGTLNFRAQAL